MRILRVRGPFLAHIGKHGPVRPRKRAGERRPEHSGPRTGAGIDAAGLADRYGVSRGDGGSLSAGNDCPAAVVPASRFRLSVPTACRGAARRPRFADGGVASALRPRTTRRQRRTRRARPRQTRRRRCPYRGLGATPPPSRDTTCAQRGRPVSNVQKEGEWEESKRCTGSRRRCRNGRGRPSNCCKSGRIRGLEVGKNDADDWPASRKVDGLKPWALTTVNT